MEYGICQLSSIPCRAEGSDKSEMLTQLLFGEAYKILDKNEKWIHITTLFDTYSCWISLNQHSPLSPAFFEKLSAEKMVVAGPQGGIAKNDQGQTRVPAGSYLPNFREAKIHFENQTLSYYGAIADENPDFVTDYAQEFLNTPYLWGGRTRMGMDCSGFTQVVFKMAGTRLDRDSSQQVKQGNEFPYSERQKGDLVFFKNTDEKVTHVGILLSANKIIHASGKVRIDPLQAEGIFNEEKRKLSHTFHSLKRMF